MVGSLLHAHRHSLLWGHPAVMLHPERPGLCSNLCQSRGWGSGSFCNRVFYFFSLELACTTCCRPGQEQEPARAAPNSPNTHPAPEAVSQSEIWGRVRSLVLTPAESESRAPAPLGITVICWGDRVKTSPDLLEEQKAEIALSKLKLSTTEQLAQTRENMQKALFETY